MLVWCGLLCVEACAGRLCFFFWRGQGLCAWCANLQAALGTIGLPAVAVAVAGAGRGGTGDRHCTVAMVCAVVMGGSCTCRHQHRTSVYTCSSNPAMCSTNPTRACKAFWHAGVSFGLGVCACHCVWCGCGQCQLGTILSSRALQGCGCFW
jgi:hypothetical protein